MTHRVGLWYTFSTTARNYPDDSLFRNPKKARQICRSCVAASGRVKPAELARNLVSLTKQAGTVYLEDVKAFSMQQPGTTKPVKWDSVVNALRTEIRESNIRLARKGSQSKFGIVGDDFIYFGG